MNHSGTGTLIADINENADSKIVTAFCYWLLQRLSEKYGGECTLNEVRCMNVVYKYWWQGLPVGPGAISRETGIPKPTVTRSVSNLISKGWINENPHPYDKRRRNLTVTEQAVNDNDWTKAVEILRPLVRDHLK